MTEAIDKIAESAQRIINDGSPPLIIVGSGMSAGYGVRGMSGLASHLVSEIIPDVEEKTKWEEFCSALSTQDLEAALQSIDMPLRLHRRILECTRDIIEKDDLEVFRQIIEGEVQLALSRLFTHLFTSTHRQANVVTTNYDRLIEYAVDQAGYMHDTGFEPGYLRTRDLGWTSPLRSSPGGPRIVNIAKVHGSVDWHKDGSGIPRSIPFLPSGTRSLSPLIVTPGKQKYRDAYEEPYRSMIQRADHAIRHARSFVCVGYGFNDEHIQPILLERLVQEKIPIVVLALELTQAARNLVINKTQGNLTLLNNQAMEVGF